MKKAKKKAKKKHAGPSDDALVRKAVKGDDDAMETLLARHAERLRRRILVRMAIAVQANASVADVLQETFASAWTTRKRFKDRDDGSFATTLGRVADNRVRDVLRRKYTKRRPFQPSDEIPASVIKLAQERAPNAEVELVAMRELLEQCVKQLPSRQLRALRLVRGRGRTHKEAGAEMGCTKGAVEKLVRRALDGLWRCVEKHASGG